MNKNLLFYLVVTILISGCSISRQNNPTPLAKFQIVGQSAKTYYVVVNPETSNNRSDLLSISKYICNNKEACYINFWDNINLAAKSYPITDAQDQAIIATYGLNKSTGYEELLVCGLGDC
jgi:hypothetical protein